MRFLDDPKVVFDVSESTVFERAEYFVIVLAVVIVLFDVTLLFIE